MRTSVEILQGIKENIRLFISRVPDAVKTQNIMKYVEKHTGTDTVCVKYLLYDWS